MPKFSQPFLSNHSDKKLSEEEIIRTIRFSIASEFEAIQMYEQIANSTINKTVQAVFQDIINEEKVHVGEFLKLLSIINPKEIDFYQKGKSEVEEKFM